MLSRETLPANLGSRTLRYAAAVLAVSATTAAIALVDAHLAIPNISLMYLPPILLVAVYFGTGPALTAAIVAALEYDFFLIRPFFTLTIAQAEDLLALVMFLIVALLTGQLAANARQRAETAQRRARESTTLYELSQALMSAQSVQEVLNVITERIVDVFQVERCAIFLPGADGNLNLAAETIRGKARDRASLAAARWAYQRGAQVRIPATEKPAMRLERVYTPLRTADRVMGVMEVGPKRGGEILDQEEQRLIASFAAQAALVVARAQGEEERRRAAVLHESDQLKSALLSAVSHDLRTPLASIKAAATALLLADATWTQEDGKDALRTIDEEADRLNRLVGNLLDLSRIEGGVLHPALDWYDAGEIVDRLLPRFRPILGDRPFMVELEPDLPALHVDVLRVEELVLNLVENAVKYAPAGTPIELHIAHDRGGVAIAVADHGPGIPGHQRTSVFATFYRGGQHSDRNPGTGLGLAICRGIAEAHGGRLDISETPGGGATFTFRLPPAQVDMDVRA